MRFWPSFGGFWIGDVVASSPELPKIGDAVADRFELRRVLGEGGMGMVYEAFDRRRQAPCAIKVLFPHYCDQPQIIARFDREAKIAARLNGANVARVFEVGALPSGVRFIAMELLVGKDLATEIQKRGRLPVGTAVDIAIQAAQAMEEAHSLGVVHRDLKPENLFLVAGGDSASGDRPTVKVLDFGISRLVHGGENLTKDFTQLGTALYMSPEQIEAASRVDRRTDVWSLGVVLYEMLVGRPPFEGQGTGVLVAIATRPVPPPSTVFDGVPPELEKVVMRALEKSPDARFESMEAFARALAPWAPTEPTFRRGRSPIRFALFGAAAAAVIGVGAVALHPRSTVLDGSASATPPPSSAPAASASLTKADSRPPSTSASIRRAPTPRGSAHTGAHPSAPRTTKRP